MKKSMVFICSLSVLSLIVLNGCKKYDDGGLASKGQQRLVSHTWELDEYIVETYKVLADDETELIKSENSNENLLISNYNITFFENGTVVRNYIDVNGNSISESGTWNIDQKTTFGLITLNNLAPIQISDELVSLSTYYEIKKLKSKQFWHYFDQDTFTNFSNNLIGSEWKNHVFKLKPKN